MAPVATPVLFAYIVFHLAALACAWGTRLAIDTRVEGLVQMAFLAALAAMGLVTLTSHLLEPGLGIPSGVTLVAMVLMSVTDFRRTHEPSHGHHVTSGR